MPWLQVFTHYLLLKPTRAIMWMVPHCCGGKSAIRRQRPLSSLVGYSSIFIAIFISVGGTRSLWGVIALCNIHIWWVDHFIWVIGFLSTGVEQLSGVMMKTRWIGLESIAAHWAWDGQRRLIYFGQFLTRWAVVGWKRVFRVAVFRASCVSIVSRQIYWVFRQTPPWTSGAPSVLLERRLMIG